MRQPVDWERQIAAVERRELDPLGSGWRVVASGSLVVLGLLAWVVAGLVYIGERREADQMFSATEPNYAPTLLLLGAGAYLVLLATILIASHRR